MSQTPKNGGVDAHESVGSDFTLVDEVVSWMNESVELETSGWQRATPTPQMFREMNKRFRTLFSDCGQQYGPDAKTMKEIDERRQAAIKIRNEQLVKTMKKIGAARHVDLCFVVDATGSMWEHIRGVKGAIRGIVNELVAKKTGNESGSKATVDTLRLAFVAYRDYGITPHFEQLDFTTSVDEFHRFCSGLRAVCNDPSADRAEDVLGGLNKALAMEWSGEENTKVIFHICDDPAHGKQFGIDDPDAPDRYPDGDPTGLTADGIFERISEKGIDYYFGKITQRTEIMIKEFSYVLGDRIDQFDIKNVQEISGSVISAVSKSVSSSMRKTATNAARPERAYRIVSAVPTTWDAHVVQNGKFIAYQLPKSIGNVVDDVPLERCRPEIARIQLAADPFAKGGERIAYYGRDLQTGEDVVLKEYRHEGSAGDSARRHELANQLQTVASYFAGLFMADCEEKLAAEKIPATLEFLMIKTLALGSMAAPRYMSCEPRLDPAATYIRFTNNWDFVMPEACVKSKGISAELLRFVVAFSHYTYTVSGGKLMVVDLQGTIKPNTSGGRPTVLLTDPAIHAEDRTRFGAMNHSKPGMSYFFENHACNDFCAALQLPAVDPASVLKTN